MNDNMEHYKLFKTHRVKQPELQRKYDSMRHLDVPVVLFHVLESLEVEREYERQFLNPHTLLRLLVAATVVALKLIIVA